MRPAELLLDGDGLGLGLVSLDLEGCDLFFGIKANTPATFPGLGIT
ncbi:MAG: hypothetical protein QNJ46_23730 [Leptolyngbyaceae cyanobacterium MO_188.B28]|nr:hypothetical protein [Leptolyngbyaceae cyanobacterium MO_188.B28]